MLARRLLGALLGAAMLPTAACYHQVVETGRAPSATVIDKPWQMSFLWGLAAPPALNVAQQCPRGVATVVTEHSFLNGLVGALTFGIVTPIHVTVTCAESGSAAATPATPAEKGAAPAAKAAGTSKQDETALLEDAIQRSMESGEAVRVQF